MPNRSCLICHRKFTPASGKQKYDTDACKYVAYRRRKTKELKPCQLCSTPFPVTKANKLYCSRQCAKKADNTTQKLRLRAEAAAKEILRQRKVEASHNAELAVAVEKVSSTPGLPKVTIRPAGDAEDALRQALEDQAGAERASVVRNEKPGFDLFDLRQYHIDQQKAERESPQGQGPTIETVRKIKSSQEGYKN